MYWANKQHKHHTALLATPVWIQSLPASLQTGFPSPAEDHAVTRVNLVVELIKHPQATFMPRASGDSIKDAGILDGSVVLIDNAIQPRDGHNMVTEIDARLFARRWRNARVALGSVGSSSDLKTDKGNHT
jgi:hypothetical protein